VDAAAASLALIKGFGSRIMSETALQANPIVPMVVIEIVDGLERPAERSVQDPLAILLTD
jgi:hypothetical protein